MTIVFFARSVRFDTDGMSVDHSPQQAKISPPNNTHQTGQTTGFYLLFAATTTILIAALAVSLATGPRNSIMGSTHSSKLKAAKEVNAAAGSLSGRVALVFGGTSGIGQALAQRLAVGGASVTIVGRNDHAGQETVLAMRAVNPAGNHTYVKCDAMLLSNVRLMTQQFVATASRLDYVVFCQTKATMQGYTPTAEGIDEKLALNYYSRVFATEMLLPLLKRTASQFGADVRVLSVLSAGVHKPYEGYAADPSLKDTYSLSNAANAAGFYTDLWRRS